MKKLITGLVTIAISLSAMAEVPSLINYQGKLSDKSGNPVNGTKNFSVRIFDAKEGGKEIYEEEVGAVAVKDGLYSFGFGEAGKSVVTPTEILARADGEKQVFNYITKNKPILGNVKISGAGLSWTDDAGSSDTSKFTSTLNKNSGAASAIFLTQAPDSGTEVLISYDHNSDGVMGALSRGGQSWLEITVGGETLSPRERLVAVPFAVNSELASSVKNLPDDLIFLDTYRGSYPNSFTRGTGYFFSDTTRNAIKLILPVRLQKQRNDQSSDGAIITLGVKHLNDKIIAKTQKIIKYNNGAEGQIEIELTDVPPEGFCTIFCKVNMDSNTHFYWSGAAFFATYKK
jgi:hypothetical protein